MNTIQKQIALEYIKGRNGIIVDEISLKEELLDEKLKDAYITACVDKARKDAITALATEIPPKV